MGCHLEKGSVGSSHCGTAETNPTSIHEDAGSIPGPTQWVKGSGIALSRGVGQQPLLHFDPLAWELPYDPAALKGEKKKGKEKEKGSFHERSMETS